ncbi:hypothetical protein VSVS12_04453 (plasmid) [Vibrio scophthalmi]|nr:hypothetical protein VSVS12_04453 [Vibrio scophthalmi]
MTRVGDLHGCSKIPVPKPVKVAQNHAPALYRIWAVIVSFFDKFITNDKTVVIYWGWTR